MAIRGLKDGLKTGEQKIEQATITTLYAGSSEIGSSEIASGAITAGKIASGVVTWAKLNSASTTVAVGTASVSTVDTGLSSVSFYSAIPHSNMSVYQSATPSGGTLQIKASADGTATIYAIA